MASESVVANWGPLILHGVRSTEKEIGRGAYGRVFEVNYEGTLCAAKEVHAILLQYAQGDDLQKIIDDFRSECQIWSTLRHPCVVQFLGVYYPAMDQYRLPVMVMEKMQHSLRGLVEKYDNIPLNVKLSILDEVCLGLRYLHSRNPPIVHRDLTPNNILLSYCLEAKITDLGVAKVVKTDNQKTMTKLPGTPDFMPPEALSVRPVYGPSLDVFSYGGVILNVTTQLWPQPTDRTQFNPDINAWEVVSEVNRRLEFLDKMTGGAVDLKPLVMSCLDDNPNNRPSLAQVSVTINRIKDKYSQMSGISPVVWWAEVSEVTSSLTTALEEMTVNNEQLKKENDTLKYEVDTIKNENKQLKLENQHLKQQLALKENAAGTLLNRSTNIKWGEKPSSTTPVGRFRHTAVCVNGLVYVGSGLEARYNSSFSIDCYDPVSNSWSSAISISYCDFAMTELNNSLLTAGGEDINGAKTYQILTLDNGQLKNYTEMITARSQAIAIGHQGMLIITGGIDASGKILSSTELFDSKSGQWYNCNDLPQPCFLLKSVIVDNILYLLGGFDKYGEPSKSVYAASLDALSGRQLQWNLYQDAPWYRSTPVSIHGKHLILIGGRNKGYRTTSNIYKLNKTNHIWEPIGQIPLASDGLAAVSTTDHDSKIIVIGGWNDRRGICNTVWTGLCDP